MADLQITDAELEALQETALGLYFKGGAIKSAALDSMAQGQGFILDYGEGRSLEGEARGMIKTLTVLGVDADRINAARVRVLERWREQARQQPAV